MNKTEEGLTNGCVQANLERNYIIKREWLDNELGTPIVDADRSIYVRIEALRDCLSTILTPMLEGYPSLREASTTGLPIQDIKVIFNHLDELKYLQDKLRSISDDYRTYCSEHRSVVSVDIFFDAHDSLPRKVGHLNSECRRVFKKYTEGWLPYIAPRGYQFRVKENHWGFWEVKDV